jgi:hypothetical protein
MPRYSSYETYSDGSYMYDDRYDAGEFDTYDESSSRGRGPSSGAYSDGESHYGNFQHDASPNTLPSRRSARDTHGYAREGSYTGEEDLRQHLGRYRFGHAGEFAHGNQSNSRTRLGRDDGYEYARGQPSGLSQEVYEVDPYISRSSRSVENYERPCAARSYAPSPYKGDDGDRYTRGYRIERRGAILNENNTYAAYVQAQMENQRARQTANGARSSLGERRSDPHLPSALHGVERSNRQWFSSYEYR